MSRDLTTDPLAAVSHRTQWFVPSVLRHTASDFFRHALALPSGTWPRWGMRLAIGWVACMILTAGITLVAKSWEQTWMGAWDERAIAAVERGPVSFSNGVLLESPGNLIYLIPLLLFVVLVSVRLRRPVFAVTIVLSWVLARTLVYWGWYLWNRPRPQVIAGGVASPPLHSFPSGHMVLSLAVYGLLVWAWCRASGSWVERLIAIIVGIAWCASLGYGRVRIGSHWPSDVIGGAVIGLAWVAVVLWALRAADESALTALRDEAVTSR